MKDTIFFPSSPRLFRESRMLFKLEAGPSAASYGPDSRPTNEKPKEKPKGDSKGKKDLQKDVNKGLTTPTKSKEQEILGKLEGKSKYLKQIKSEIATQLVENPTENLAKINNKLEEIDRLIGLYSDEVGAKTACGKAKKDMLQIVIADVQTNAEEGLEAFDSKQYEESIIRGHLTDVLNAKLKKEGIEVTSEDVKKALLYYELGKHKNGKAEGKTGAILSAMKDLQKKEKLADEGIRLNYVGGTDATGYRLPKNMNWHYEKIKAFTLFKEFSADRVSMKNRPDMKLIDKYIAAVETGKIQNIINLVFGKTSVRKAFLKGGGLFDVALAVQRADEMKMKMEGSNLDGKKDYLYLEIGDTKNSKNERKSGLRLSHDYGFELIEDSDVQEKKEPAKKKEAAPAKPLEQREKQDPLKLIEKIKVYIDSEEFGDLFQSIYRNLQISKKRKFEIETNWIAKLRLEFVKLQNRAEGMPSNNENPETLAKEIITYRSKLNKFVEELKKELRDAESKPAAPKAAPPAPKAQSAATAPAERPAAKERPAPTVKPVPVKQAEAIKPETKVEQKEQPDIHGLLEKISNEIKLAEFADRMMAVYMNPNILTTRKNEIEEYFRATLRLELKQLKNRAEGMPANGEKPADLLKDIANFQLKLSAFVQELKDELKKAKPKVQPETTKARVETAPVKEKVAPGAPKKVEKPREIKPDLTEKIEQEKNNIIPRDYSKESNPPSNDPQYGFDASKIPNRGKIETGGKFFDTNTREGRNNLAQYNVEYAARAAALRAKVLEQRRVLPEDIKDNGEREQADLQAEQALQIEGWQVNPEVIKKYLILEAEAPKKPAKKEKSPAELAEERQSQKAKEAEAQRLQTIKDNNLEDLRKVGTWFFRTQKTIKGEKQYMELKMGTTPPNVLIQFSTNPFDNVGKWIDVKSWEITEEGLKNNPDAIRYTAKLDVKGQGLLITVSYTAKITVKERPMEEVKREREQAQKKRAVEEAKKAAERAKPYSPVDHKDDKLKPDIDSIESEESEYPILKEWSESKTKGEHAIRIQISGEDSGKTYSIKVPSEYEVKQQGMNLVVTKGSENYGYIEITRDYHDDEDKLKLEVHGKIKVTLKGTAIEIEEKK